MKYFTYHPKIFYNFDGINVNVIDIFRKNDIELSSQKLINTTLTESETTPEDIAKQYYSKEEDSWFVNLTNKIYLRSDWKWPLDIKTSENNTLYDNQLVYSIQTLPDLQEGDIITDEVDGAGTKFVYVKSWNPEFRSIVVMNSSGVSFEANDIVYFYRKTDDELVPISFLSMGTSGTDGITTSTQISKVTNYVDYPIRFKKDDEAVSPYYGSSPGNTYITNTTLSLLGADGFTYTALNKFNRSTLSNSFSYTSSNIGASDIDINNIKIDHYYNSSVASVFIKENFDITDKKRNYTIIL